ncbi:Put3p ASCRUDRAFT_77719 [Ascoidea rubescens DSM 1968]|uniref:Xylanolytic transcriptional activator regulatory domain-containing protein n=1 Tax=Ascoidea rubescens DSM 1968 TaxID=1344418 RepID=A0A1D2VAU8_9ASCO|nr:hypothetical protein ASCRUDRAFT_77719 [Ascoidea rubescens DSM 1968]ODV58719.1 hypothetical protein ASCRUDRAFT_77719 [Ascoidea rubescens DSM 1968]
MNSNKSSPKLPGSGFFNQASKLFSGLFESSNIDHCAKEGGVEVMLLYAFYLQVADCTVSSYFYFGLALRSALILGMHVDAEKNTLTRFELEHRRRLWWTVYMFERMLSSKVGLPLSLTDDSISVELPNDFNMSNPPLGCEHYIFPEAEYIKNCVLITQINSKILSNLYQKPPTKNILPILLELIEDLLNWEKNLPNFLKPDFQKSDKILKISRLITNLFTEYFQGINLAVRPLLFHFTNKQLRKNQNKNIYIDLTFFSKPILNLLNSSFQASINTIRSLWSLMPENMIALFGYMDREYLFTSSATLILFNAAFGVHKATFEHLDHALIIFTKMRNLGNHPANLRRCQLLKLLKVLDFNGVMHDLIVKHDDDIEMNNFFNDVDRLSSAQDSLIKDSNINSDINQNPNENNQDNQDIQNFNQNFSQNVSPSLDQNVNQNVHQNMNQNYLYDQNLFQDQNQNQNHSSNVPYQLSKGKQRENINGTSHNFTDHQFNSKLSYKKSQLMQQSYSMMEDTLPMNFPSYSTAVDSNRIYRGSNLSSVRSTTPTLTDSNMLHNFSHQNPFESFHIFSTSNANTENNKNSDFNTNTGNVNIIAHNNIDTINNATASFNKRRFSNSVSDLINLGSKKRRSSNSSSKSSSSNSRLEAFLQPPLVSPDSLKILLKNCEASESENALWNEITDEAMWLGDFSEEFNKFVG